MLKNIIFNLFAINLLFYVVNSQAQIKPDAASLLPHVESMWPRDIVAPKVERVEEMRVDRPVQPPTGLQVFVTKFLFVGNIHIPDDQLQAVLAPYLNRSLGFLELQQAVKAIAMKYRDMGWMSYVFLPPQEIERGIVTIKIVEGVLGKIEFEVPQTRNTSKEQIERVFHALDLTESPLSLQRLDFANQISNSLSGVQVKTVLIPGSEVGTVDLAISISDLATFSGVVAVDNSGAASTGSGRVGIVANWRGLAGIGDNFGTNLISSSGSDFVRLSYSLPFGDLGGRFGVGAAKAEYRSSLLGDISLDGSADVFEMEVIYPIFQKYINSMKFSTSFNKKHFDNRNQLSKFMPFESSSHYSQDTITFTLDGWLRDSFGSRGDNFVSVALTAGALNLKGSANEVSDAKTTKTAGDFNKLRLLFTREQVLSSDLNFLVTLAAQWANKNLDGSEKFYLGGVEGVRAYPTNEAGGSEGSVLNFELRRWLNSHLSMVAFYDWGRVRVNRENDFSGAALVNDLSLKGGGLSLVWKEPTGTELKLSWARRSGANPNPSFDGNDQDGTKFIDRIWVTAKFPF